ncbi:TlyA family RNA methyltransferase [Corynebacterium marinum]|uniref:16S/23S rRNA (Cytidine-2'-O)-methyltransferase TlyA n=1 Tax=Corynebacterium marinum DSM 44953 TaxID=1224162 RepID=A0A0B6TR88_9CORY|nr:TlyA family RNA methyltransferase [Corynebacterium marinum]AJK68784.1 16S/23S rRNA (cytidine-2'-O)-methyltransferase TlyA [Corynebacterium marinum DSM 44953]GGO21475.1 TlyA family rRNA (cytidine-2'-O)-methyltransferase [Corynebacterium marinum]
MAVARRRLDAELVRRKIARSREQAVEMIRAGRVFVGGFQAMKPATVVEPEVSIRVEETGDDDWASRGAHKLLGALEAFEPQGLTVAGRKVLDAGASTGGFTDVLLRRDAAEVVAVDVGYGQLIWRLQNDPRVTVLDRTNIRNLTPEMCGGQCDMMVGDLSFISLRLTLPAIAASLTEGADLLPMVKPQFEVGKDRLGSGGVVRSPQLRAEVTREVAEFALTLGLSCRGAVASPLPGPSGNVEYFLWLVKDGGASAPAPEQLTLMIEQAVQEGPQ